MRFFDGLLPSGAMRPVVVLALLLTGCLPNLGPWEIQRRDAGLDPTRDAGPRPDGAVDSDAGRDLPPLDDCTAPIPIGAGYAEGFEGGPARWGVGEADTPVPASWGLGVPSGALQQESTAWVTALDGDYPAGERSYVTSPCFDASGATNDLLLTLRVASETEDCCDGGFVEMSLDGGATWTAVSGEPRLGWYGAIWDGERAWQTVSAILPMTARAPSVRLRVGFRSDSSIQGEGFAFDDVALRATTVDLAARIEPAERCGYARAVIENVGGVPVTGYQIVSTVDGTSETTPFDDTLAYRQERVVEIGAGLAQRITARGVEVGDVDPSNDLAELTVASTPFPAGGVSWSFEADAGDLELGGENPSWAWGEPRGALFSAAASGARAWVTNLEGDYNRSERSWLATRCWDMSALSRDPTLVFNLVYATEQCCDVATVQMSVDGSDFAPVGTMGSGIGSNWFTRSGGWSGSSGAGVWQTAQHPLEGAGGHRYVRVRFHFRSDGSGENEGFGIDDVNVVP